ncbi:MAG: RDD family protein [Cytophagaceae bacterium]|nr:RDD family protein [Cytophagaceae bacterium]
MDIKNPENVTVVDGYTLASPFERIIAFLIDFVVYAVLQGILLSIFYRIGLPWLGAMISMIYILFRDCLKFLHYQSIGKLIMKLQVIKADDQTRITPLDSLKRNFIFLPNLFIVFGMWHTAWIIVIILILIEIYLLYTFNDNQRLGDQFADTIVIEKSI